MKTILPIGLMLIAAPLMAQTAPAPAPAPAPGASPAKLDLASKQIYVSGDPWNIYGPTQTSAVLPHDGPQNYPATRATISAKTPNAWDDGSSLIMPKEIAAGDVILVGIYMRAPEAKDGETVDLPFIGMTGATAPYDNVASGHPMVTNQWKMYYAVGKAPHAFPASSTQATVHLGSDKHVIDLGPIRVFDLGPDFNQARLRLPGLG